MAMAKTPENARLTYIFNIGEDPVTGRIKRKRINIDHLATNLDTEDIAPVVIALLPLFGSKELLDFKVTETYSFMDVSEP